MEIKCKQCGKEFTDEPNDFPGKVYEHRGEAICEDCMIGMGVLPDHKKEDHFHLITDNLWFMRP